MNITIDTTNNGYLVEIKSSLKNNGRYVFKSTETLLVLEFVGSILNDKKVAVKER